MLKCRQRRHGHKLRRTANGADTDVTRKKEFIVNAIRIGIATGLIRTDHENAVFLSTVLFCATP